MKPFAPAALALALAACALEAPVPAPAPVCPVAGEAPMTMVRLYFGRGIAASGAGAPRGFVSDAEWDAFARATIAPAFADGFTLFDAEGRDGGAAGARGAREATKVLEAAVPRGADIAAKLAAVTEAYTARFAQRAVGVATWHVCGGF